MLCGWCGRFGRWGFFVSRMLQLLVFYVATICLNSLVQRCAVPSESSCFESCIYSDLTLQKSFFLYFVGKSPAQVHVVPLAIYFWFWSLNVCRLCVESCFSVFSRADMSFVRAYVLFVLNLLFISIDMLLHIYSQTPCILLFRHVTAKSMPRHSCIQIFTHFCILVLVRLGMHDFRTILHVRDRSFNHLWFSHTFEFCDQMFGNLWFSYTFEFL